MSPEDEVSGTEQAKHELDQEIENLCNSKAEEFRLLGYDAVSGEDVWLCVSEKYSKKGTPQLHEIVNDILSLKVTKYMNWLTLRMYKGL
jgi:Post-transcriptional regulator